MSASSAAGDPTSTFMRRSISPPSRGSYIDVVEPMESTTRTGSSLSDNHLGTYNPVATEEPETPSTAPSRVESKDQTEAGRLRDTRAPYRPLGKLAALRAWAFEFLALFVSVASFTAIVVLLKLYDQLPQPSFSFGISISTLIALFTTALRASMIFTIAEVVGQSKWLWMAKPHPARHIEIPTAVCAIVVVASYAIGLFSQQAAKTYSCDIESHGTAKIAIAEWVGKKDAASADVPSYMLWLSPEMHTVAMNGLLTGETNRSLGLYQCDSSNCTLPTTSGSGVTHTSVGLCSKCIDIRSSVREANGSSTVEKTYSLGSNLTIIDTYEPVTLRMKAPSLLHREDVDFDFESGTPNTTIIAFTVAGCKRNSSSTICEHKYDNMPELRRHLDVVAANCSLYPCLRSYNGRVSNGILEETLVSTSPINRAKWDSREQHTVDPGAQTGVAGESELWATHRRLLGGCGRGWWVDGLFNKGLASFETIYAAFNNTATAMTNRMRSYDDNSWSRDSQAFVHGSGTQAAVCIRADWLWLMYPGVLLLLTSILLLQAYVKSCVDRTAQPVWKSAILPLLFYNIISENSNSGDQDLSTPVVGPTVPLLQLPELELLAEKTVVRFCKGFDGDKGPGLVVEEEPATS
ncbi:unnamed protein product [Colletotrichum noveboracense]|uniref:Uncharacterized protein n=1 Tax=Colletotrichum noveboracense TaxID=2664923 RepID=A0A9W4S3N2_9PEZI|nr:unnamed protein product [Colletotrichum noveboracense]